MHIVLFIVYLGYQAFIEPNLYLPCIQFLWNLEFLFKFSFVETYNYA